MDFFMVLQNKNILLIFLLGFPFPFRCLVLLLCISLVLLGFPQVFGYYSHLRPSVRILVGVFLAHKSVS